MARQRRGGSSTGGFKPPDLKELKGTLGTLLRSANVVRDVLERGAREGRARFDDARQHRRRADALAELGEIVLDLIRRGEIDPEDLPEIREVVQQLDDIDGDAHAGAAAVDEDAVTLPPTSRTRFDDRKAPTATVPAKTAARPRPDVTQRDMPAARDGVSSRDWSPPPPKPAARVWRPVDEPPAHGEEEPTRPPPFRGASLPPRKGGISFDGDDDADLADYMHPDDVPAPAIEPAKKEKDPDGDA